MSAPHADVAACPRIDIELSSFRHGDVIPDPYDENVFSSLIRDLALTSPRASILDIARTAQVSPATVSRAFNQPQLVNPQTLARILSVAHDAGFRPNRVGSSLRSGSTRTLGLVLPTLINPVFAECFEGAEARARSDGYSVMVTTTGYDRQRERDAVSLLLDHRVEGIVVTVTHTVRNPVLEQIAAGGVPYVLAYNESAIHPCVSVDNARAAEDVIAALAALGHHTIAVVTGPLAASDRAGLRLDGARRAARRLGLPAPCHIELPSHTEACSTTLADALEGPSAPTAMFCSNDLLAAAVIAAVSALGQHVPRDLSVCGFDGVPFGAHMVPPLASLAQPSRDIGALACDLLLGALLGAPLVSRCLPHRFIAGGTVAAAPIRPAHLVE
ncbi:LacI family DNA-binding transcriptional regulator [Achromobacter sp. KS-M25]|nr:LacI family DNA-binding transcriptional regulator [Achromobacter aestuarii]